jgi:hypothetical protein
MFQNIRVLGSAIILATTTASATAAPDPSPPLSLRSLDIELDLPDLLLEIHGFSAYGPVVLTGPVFASGWAGNEDAHGPLLRAFVLAETDSGPTGCRWIAGWADLTARGVFCDAGKGTLSDASGLGGGSGDLPFDSSSLPRWYLALRPR